MRLTDIKDLSLVELKRVLESWGQEPFRAVQIFEGIYKKGAVDFKSIRGLPAALSERLEKSFTVLSFSGSRRLVSKDGTSKFLFTLHDGHLIESVVIPAKGRVTACLSTQVGCKYRCLFCASGMNGLKRDLFVSEIIEQLLLIGSFNRIDHIVFMGIGEPFDNYDNFIKAARLINAKEVFNIGARKITVSTSGVIPGIRKFMREGLQVELAVSLHAADEVTRSRLMPINRKYPLSQLIPVLREYVSSTRRQVTFEYVMLKGVNLGLKAAGNLCKILRGMDCKINLIPFNPVKELDGMSPDEDDAASFKKALETGGLRAVVRKPRGQDIFSACGQLRAESLKAEVS